MDRWLAEFKLIDTQSSRPGGGCDGRRHCPRTPCPGCCHLDRRGLDGHDRGAAGGAPRDLGENRFQTFHAVEHGLVWQARAAVLVVGLTGFYMAWRLDLWDRFRVAEF